MKRLTGLFVVFGLASGVYATYAGSVVASWYADRVYEQGWYYYPCAVTYGGGYLWLPYATLPQRGVVTKRVPSNGSIVSSYSINFIGRLPPKFGYRNNPAYLYAINQNLPIQWFDAETGSLVGTFYRPQLYWPTGIDYDDTHPARPLWVCQHGTGPECPAMIWNLSSEGNIVSSFNLQGGPVNPYVIAYAHNVPGGPYLYVGTQSSPTMIFVMNPQNGSVHGSFRAPIAANALTDLTWDGEYLWAGEDGGFPEPPHIGWVFRLVARDFPSVEPASVGKIKALYR